MVTREGPAPQVEILSQQWEPPILSLVLYNTGGLGIVIIGLYGGGRYLGSIQVRAPTPGQTSTYNLRALVEMGTVFATIISTQGDPVAITIMRVETYSGKTVTVETRLLTRYYDTSIEERKVVSTFVGTRTLSLFEDPFQRAILAISFAGLVGGVVVAVIVAVGARQRREEEQKEREKRRRETRLVWSVIPPTKLRMGGHTRLFNEISNLSEGPTTNVVLTASGPTELDFPLTLKIGIVKQKERKVVPFRISSKRGAPKKEYPLSLTLTCIESTPQTRMIPIIVDVLKVGVLLDRHNAAYAARRGGAADSSEIIIAWLSENNFEYRLLGDAEDLGISQDCKVIVASCQYALSGRDVEALRKFASGGGGLVAIGGVGVIDADQSPTDEPSYVGSRRVFELYGYSEPIVAELAEGLQGFHIVDGAHPITRRLEGAMFSLPKQRGIVFSSSTSMSRTLADQRVMIAGKAGYVGIPALSARELGIGRVVHFNVDMTEHINVFSPLFEKALLWAGRFE